MRTFNRYSLERELELFESFIERLFKSGRITEEVRDRQLDESIHISSFIPVGYGDRFLPDERAVKSLAAIRAFNTKYNLR